MASSMGELFPQLPQALPQPQDDFSSQCTLAEGGSVPAAAVPRVLGNLLHLAREPMLLSCS